MRTLKDDPVVPFMNGQTTRVIGANRAVHVLKTIGGLPGVLEPRIDAGICREWLRECLPHKTYIELVRMIQLHDVPNLPEV